MKIIGRIAAAAVSVFAATALAACGLAGGNSKENIDSAVKTLNERFGTEFTLRKKKFSGGAACSVLARCAETGGKDIFIFQYDKKNKPQTDYIYVRYGKEALARITELSKKACPGCKVIVNERVYNHLDSDRYDKNTDLAGYLAENEFYVDVYMPRMLGKTELEAFYHSLEEFLHGDGIYCKAVILGCPEDFDSVVPPDHILCSNEEQYEGLAGKPVYTYSAKCVNYITRNSVSFDSSSPYAVFIDGQRAK